MGEENFLRKSRRLKRKQHNESIGNLQIKKNRKLSTSISKSAKKIQLCKQSASKKYPERSANNNQLYKAGALHPKNGNPETVSSIVVLRRFSPRLLKMKKITHVETKEGEKIAEENFLKKSRRHKRKRHDSIENLQIKKNRNVSTSVNKSAEKTQLCRKNSQEKYLKRSANCSQLCKPAVLHSTNSKMDFSTVESKRTSPRLSKMEKINYVETKNYDVNNLKPGESVVKKRKNKLSNKETSEIVARRYTFPLETGYRKSLKSNKLGKKQASSTRNSYDSKNIHVDCLSSENNKMAMVDLYALNFKHLKNVPVDDLFKLKPSENSKVTKTALKSSDNLTLKGIKNSESPCALLKKKSHGISKRNSKIRVSDKVIEEFHCNEILPDCNDDPKKRPRKKTLKHKRWLFEKLQGDSIGYEDDIYESKSFDAYKCLTQLESESEASFNIATPECGFAVTPIAVKKTPAFKDCFSPMELMRNRKHAEEYMYRRHNRKVESKKSQVQEPEIPEKKKLDFEETLSIIRKKLSNLEESVNQGYSSDEENLSDS
ncbi:hypothetical protein X975_04296, partial [Stegodyphus mimosarum]